MSPKRKNSTYQQLKLRLEKRQTTEVKHFKKPLVLSWLVLFLSASCGTAWGPTAKQEIASESDNPAWLEADFVFKNEVLDSGLRTLQLRSSESDIVFPFIELNSGQRLRMTFDDISGKPQGMEYALVHCTHDWTRSSLSEMDYMQGFSRNNPDEVVASSGSEVPFINYEFVFPNDFCKIRISGNYALVLFRTETPDKPAAILRFVVFEKLVGVVTQIKEPTVVAEARHMQEIDVTIKHDNYRIDRPNTDLHITILQNGRWDNAINNLRPRFIQDKTINYDYGEENNMEGGAEFRHLNLRTVGSASFGLKEFKQEQDGMIHAYVHDKSLAFSPYLSNRDINGKYEISSTIGWNSRTDAHYIYVHFRLDSPYPLPDEQVFVAGQFSLYEQRKPYLMTYDHDLKAYTCLVLMKQGYYNYHYITLGKDKKPGLRAFEGSHFGTENEYQVFAYNYDPLGGYDRVIGVMMTNNFNK